MALRGFWSACQEEPGGRALVDPAGLEVSAGELGGAANRLVHGLRARGMTAGDGVAVVLPNSRELFEVLLAAMQAGCHCTPRSTPT